MTRKIIFCLGLAMAVAGTASAQIVADIGASVTTQKAEDENGGITATTSRTFISVPFSVGYRAGATGFGLAAVIGSNQYDYNASRFAPEGKDLTVNAGGYFEYALLSTEKATLFGKAGVGYSGKFGSIVASSFKNDTNGFYVNIAPVFEYKIFKHISLFASATLLSFNLDITKSKQKWVGTEWVDLPDGESHKQITTALISPFLSGQSLSSITLGCKFIF
jgi:hypothetical protein